LNIIFTFTAVKHAAADDDHICHINSVAPFAYADTLLMASWHSFLCGFIE
jgi:hypothetical protein